MLDQSALAHSRTAVHAEHDGLAAPDRGKRILQRRQVLMASHQDLAASRFGNERAGLDLFWRRLAQLSEDFGPGRASVGITRQKGDAQPIQVRGNPGGYLRRRNDIIMLLGPQHLQGISLEGKSSRQRLVEHGSQVVPIAGRRDRARGRLFRRHVGQGPQEVILRALVQTSLVQFRRQTEIQEHHSPLGGDQHVPRLDVAVELSCLVQSRDPLRQLTQRLPQPAFMEGTLGIRRAHVTAEIESRNELHGEKPGAAVGDQIVEPHQVAVRDAGQRAKLLFEAV